MSSPAEEARAVAAKVMAGFGVPDYSKVVPPDDFAQARLLKIFASTRTPAWVSPASWHEARRLVTERSATSWAGLGSILNNRRRYRLSVGVADRVRHFRAPEVELVILRLLSATSPANELTVDSKGAVFTTPVRGYSKSAERFYLSGLSPLIDDLGQCLWEYRTTGPVKGGRMYERRNDVFDAKSGLIIARIECQ